MRKPHLYSIKFYYFHQYLFHLPAVRLCIFCSVGVWQLVAQETLNRMKLQ